MNAFEIITSLGKNISLRKKLLLVILTATNTALLLTSVAVILYDRQSAKYSMQQEMKVLSSVISQRSAAALLFQDKQLAEENLHTLSERSVVTSACIYDNDGVLFAMYSAGKNYICSDTFPQSESGFVENGFLERRDIELNGARVGYLYIAASLDEIDQRSMRFVWIVVLIFIMAGFIAFLLAVKLQRIITRPIDELAAASRKIHHDKSYSIRVKKVTNDEIGQLVTAFNEMLEDIEDRDAMLVDAKKNLEEIVRERTEKLRETQNELIRKDRMATLGQLTATVSHELRNPLGTIRTSVFTLSNRLNIKDESIKRVIDRIDRNIVRCDSVITELLDYSRIRAIQHQKTNLASWIMATLGDMDIPGDIDVSLDLDESISAEIDRDLFRRVMTNVVANAVQALGSEEYNLATKKIIIECRLNAGRIEIIINDTGPGIDAQILPRIFEPLFSTRNHGIGLGLSIVKQVMMQHGGSVEVVSEASIGTRVILWLPSALKLDTHADPIAARHGY